MTMNPIFLPDEGIANFVNFGLEKNPQMRFIIQQSWLIFDQRGEPETEVLYAKRKYNKKLDPNARTVDEIRKEYAPVFAALEDHVRELNKQVGREVVFICPVGRASILLREKIIAHQAPDLESQKRAVRRPRRRPRRNVPPQWNSHDPGRLLLLCHDLPA